MQQESPQPLQQPTSSSERARDLMTPGVVALPIATRLPVAARALAAHRVSPFATRSEVVRELSQPGVNRLAVQERSDWMPEGVISDLDLTVSATVDIN